MEHFWPAVPSILWFFFAITIAYCYRSELRNLLVVLDWRLRSGGNVKFGSIEIGAIRAEPGAPVDTAHGQRLDDGERDQERSEYYASSRGIMLVHRIFRSNAADQLYDTLIYCVPHGGATLATVKCVEFYLGHMWGNRIFTSGDRSRGFPVLTSAYGPFLCTARLIFNDNTVVVLHRYVDFEMGAYAPAVAQT